MTHEADLLVLHLPFGGIIRTTCKSAGVEWPPPMYLAIDGQAHITDALPVEGPHLLLKRVNMSKITDEQIATMSHVCRGAEYETEPS
jgi:hypothetical protein